MYWELLQWIEFEFFYTILTYQRIKSEQDEDAKVNFQRWKETKQAAEREKRKKRHEERVQEEEKQKREELAKETDKEEKKGAHRAWELKVRNIYVCHLYPYLFKLGQFLTRNILSCLTHCRLYTEMRRKYFIRCKK